MRLILFFLFYIFLAFFVNQDILAQLKFAVIGDYGDVNDEEAAVSDMIDTWNVEFVITVGDNNYNNGYASTIDPNIGRDYNQWIYPYNGDYPPGGSPDNINRFFPSLGNHDYANTLNPDAAQPYLDYFELPGNERWYSFKWGNIDFFVLDSQLGWIDEYLAEQSDWLQNKVANSTAQWKVVYFHHPPYASGGNHSRMRFDYKSLNIDLVLSGHDHLYERLEVDGLTYIVNGLGGKSIDGLSPPIPASIVQYDEDYGAQLITVNENEMTLEFWSIGRSFNNVPQLIDTHTIYSDSPPPLLPPVVSNGAGFALDFDGINDHVLVPDDNSLDITSTITLEAWVKPDEVSTQYLIKKAIYNGESGDNGYELSLSDAQSGTKFFFRLNQQESGNTYRLNSITQYQTGLWTHVAATYDGDSMHIYINGIEDNSLFTPTPVTIHSNDLPLGLGAQSDGGSTFNGHMDEVRIWNVARTELQIREYMCKKLTRSETGLVGYWRFDETQGLSTIDETTNNNNHGTMINMSKSDRIWSSTTLGNDIAYDYDSDGGYTVNLSHIDGDNFTATAMSGNISGIQVYRVDTSSVRVGSTVPDNYTVDELRYWGVHVIGSDNPTYDIVYNYNGHPGILTETNLRLVKRNDNSDPDWVDAGASLDVNAKTLSLATQSGTEYALASISDPLPVELTSFNAKVLGKDVHLFWQTKTEVNNYGFDIERNSDNSAWIEIGFAKGHGNSNSPRHYNFMDINIEQSGQYYYRLKQTDNDGTFEYSHTIKVTVGVPDAFYLSQNYPNPFNPVTLIKYQIPKVSFVTLKVYDVLGREVLNLVNEEKQAGSFEVEFDGRYLTSGIYFYKLIAGEFIEAKSMMLMK